MTNPSLSAIPSRAEGLVLHLHLLDQNPTAVADVCRTFLDPLLGWLAIQFADVDPHFRQSAVHDAIMSYVKSPHAYDPARGDLGLYLRMAARGDLANLLQRERKHHKGHIGWAIVDDGRDVGNLVGEQDPALQVELAEEMQRWRAFLEAAVEDFTEEERRVLELMLGGERKTGAYVEALGIGGLPDAEREREVKKVKDRIKKRLQRGVRDHDRLS